MSGRIGDFVGLVSYCTYTPTVYVLKKINPWNFISLQGNNRNRLPKMIQRAPLDPLALEIQRLAEIILFAEETSEFTIGKTGEIKVRGFMKKSSDPKLVMGVLIEQLAQAKMKRVLECEVKKNEKYETVKLSRMICQIKENGWGKNICQQLPELRDLLDKLEVESRIIQFFNEIDYPELPDFIKDEDFPLMLKQSLKRNLEMGKEYFFRKGQTFEKKEIKLFEEVMTKEFVSYCKQIAERVLTEPDPIQKMDLFRIGILALLHMYIPEMKVAGGDDYNQMICLFLFIANSSELLLDFARIDEVLIGIKQEGEFQRPEEYAPPQLHRQSDLKLIQWFIYYIVQQAALQDKETIPVSQKSEMG